MTITYCRDDSVGTPSRWTGAGRLLTEYEVDYNFYQHETRIAALEADVTVNVSISSITQPTANTLLFTMSDASTRGPFTLPSATFRDRGEWAPTTAYLVNDTFTASGALYRVIFDHTSGATFSPTANDGTGHDYYAAMLSSPGNSLPTGGATGQVLQKSSGSDFSVSWGYKLPTGGTAGQVLRKASSSNQDSAWDTIAASEVSFTPSTASGMSSSNVADAIEEAAAMGGSGASALSDLTDVDFGTAGADSGAILYLSALTAKWTPCAQPSNGDVLSFNTTTWAWEPGALSLVQLRNPTVTNMGSVSGSVDIDPDVGNVFILNVTGDLTLGASSVPDGAEITLLLGASGTTSRTVTFSSGGFTSQGTLATGTVDGKIYIIKFVAISGRFYEVSRTAAM